MSRSTGNDAFKLGDYTTAVMHYTKALDNSNPEDMAQLLCNRSAAKLHLNDASGALKDAELATRMIPGWSKVHHRMGQALVALNLKDQARDAYNVSDSYCISPPHVLTYLR